MKRLKVRLHPGTVVGLQALPPELRSRLREDYDEGILTAVEPVAVLSRPLFPVVAEVLRVRDRFAEDDVRTSYTVRLVNVLRPFSQEPAVAVEYDPGDYSRGGYGELLALLKDAAAYAEALDRTDV